MTAKFDAAIAGGLLLVYLTFYTTRETEFALITQFGRPVRTVVNAGLHVKWPFQSILRFDRRLRVYNPRPSEFLTRDKKNLVIENYVAWRIEDPDRFVKSVGDTASAEMRLHDIIWSGLSAALGTLDLESLVSASTDKVQAASMLDMLTTERRPHGAGAIWHPRGGRSHQAPESSGTKQAERVRAHAGRARAHRHAVPRGRRRAGAGDSRQRRPRERRDPFRRLQGRREDSRRRRRARPRAFTAQAYSKNPRFYKLVRTLESYKKVLDDKTTIILNSDSALLKVLTQGEAGVK